MLDDPWITFPAIVGLLIIVFANIPMLRFWENHDSTGWKNKYEAAFQSSMPYEYTQIVEKLRANRFNCPTQYVDAAANAIEALEAELARARNDALEEAAKVAEEVGAEFPQRAALCAEIQHQIRSLKEKPND